MIFLLTANPEILSDQNIFIDNRLHLKSPFLTFHNFVHLFFFSNFAAHPLRLLRWMFCEC